VDMDSAAAAAENDVATETVMTSSG